MSLLFALLAALSNALNVVLQHVASIGDPEHSKGWRFVRYLVSSPLWLLGWVALAGAFVFQAIARHNGAISVVQPLLVTELVFALVLRWLWLHQSIRPVTWWAAALTWISLTLFIAVAEPSGGAESPRAGHGRRPCRRGRHATLLALVGRSGSPGRRAALLGASASMLWALVATLIKATTDALTHFGCPERSLLGRLTPWPSRGWRGIVEPGRPPCRPAQHRAAVHRHRRPHREHRARASDLRGFHPTPPGSPSACSPSPACASPSPAPLQRTSDDGPCPPTRPRWDSWRQAERGPCAIRLGRARAASQGNLKTALQRQSSGVAAQDPSS